MESIIRDTPLVSIILNTRNRSKILSRAINSALNQSYSNFELIVVDGASTDNTKDVVMEFSKVDRRVKYLYVTENKNAAYCLNLGFKEANGEFIAILDDDDEFLPTKIEKQVDLMISGGESLGIVYCWEEYWDDKLDCSIKYGKEISKGDLYTKLLMGPCTGGGTLMLVRKAAIDKAGGYDDTIRFGSDYQFNLNISKYFKHNFVPEVLVKTHWNHEYVQSTTQPGGHVNYDAIIEYYEKILSDHVIGFNQFPRARIWHYKAIISAASRLGRYKIAFAYVYKGINLSMPIPVRIKFFYSSLRRIMISIIFRK